MLVNTLRLVADNKYSFVCFYRKKIENFIPNLKFNYKYSFKNHLLDVFARLARPITYCALTHCDTRGDLNNWFRNIFSINNINRIGQFLNSRIMKSLSR